MSQAVEQPDSDRHEPPDVLQRPHDAAGQMVLRKCWDRINRKNEHFVAAIVGREGVGKSHTAAKIGEVLDDQFTHDQILFEAADFLELLRDGKYRPGAIYVLDEAGVAFGKRSWQDRSQVLANQAMQLIRSHNIGLIFTLPRLDELDSQTQGRLQAFYEIVRKQDGKHVVGHWKWIDPDRSGTTGEIYKKYPRTQFGDRITHLRFSPPSDEVVEPYEERKEAYQQEIYDEAIEALRDEEGDDDAQENNTDRVTEILEDIDDPDRFVKAINNGARHIIDKSMIEVEYDIGSRRSSKIAKALKPKVSEDVL